MSLFSVRSAYAQNFAWANNMGGTSTDDGSEIAVDASGNVYTAGYFIGTADFDPTAGVSNLTSAGNQDIFVTKFDASGSFIWAKRIGGTNSEIPEGMTVDASGNVIIVGNLYNTVDFDPDPNTTFNLTPSGTDVFICKLDASGNFVWAKQLGSSNTDVSYAVTSDAAGNIYTLGGFNGTADFDPNAGTSNLTANGSGRDIFISKLDASGNFVWAKRMGGTSNEYAYALALDSGGNICITGTFEGTANFDTGAGTANLTSAGWGDIFICKLNADGDYLWAKGMGANVFMNNDEGRAIAVDASGNICVAGRFSGTVDFDPGLGTTNLNSSSGGNFVCKFDASGNFIWAKNISATITSIALGTSGKVYTTGNFSGTVDFDPGSGTTNLSSPGNSDVFVNVLDASGNFVEAQRIGGTTSDNGNGITTDAAENIYIIGSFTGTVDFDPSSGVYNLTPNGNIDAFVTKWSSASIAITSGNQVMCVGSVGSVTFTATSAASSPVYQWKKNNINVGTNSATYTDAALADGDVISCVIADGAINLTTNSITITVSPLLTPSVTIVANPSGAIYTTSSVTFTATPTNSGTTPSYQWQRNGANVGTNSPTYTNSSWTNGDVVTCILTSNHPCATPTTATSNSITIAATTPPAATGLHLDGTNDYVTLPNLNPISDGVAGEYTVETWVKLNAYTSSLGCWIYGDENANNGGIIMQISATGYIWTYRQAAGIVTSTAQVPLNTWTHIAFSQDASNLKLYVNGVFIQNLLSGTNRHIETTNAPRIGATGTTRLLNGTLDEMRIWNKALTPSEIQSRMSCELSGNESGLVAYYKFNQGAEGLTNTGLTTLTDATSNANNGTLTNFALTGATSNWVAGNSSIGALVTPSVAVAASPSGAITTGTSVTFTATPTNGGTTPTYQWKKNGNDVGTNSATYTDAVLANNDVITCVMTSNAACATTATANSNNITMTVNAVLPIELLSFNGQATEGGNLLTWQTAEETNASHFDVEKSLDGKNFYKIGVVKTKGNYTNYEFSDDKNNASLSYYRLKMNDLDNKFSYSKTISILREGKGKVKIYPSVTADNIVVEGAKSLEIVNALGQVLIKQIQLSNSTISLQSLPSGIYFVRGEATEGGYFVEKIIKE